MRWHWLIDGLIALLIERDVLITNDMLWLIDELIARLIERDVLITIDMLWLIDELIARLIDRDVLITIDMLWLIDGLIARLIDRDVLITNDMLSLTGSGLHGCDSATDGLLHSPVQTLRQPLRQRGRGHRRHPAHLFQLLRLLLHADVPTEKCRSQTLPVFWTAPQRTSS